MELFEFYLVVRFILSGGVSAQSERTLQDNLLWLS